MKISLDLRWICDSDKPSGWHEGLAEDEPPLD